MGSIDKIVEQMRLSPQNIKFSELCKVCEYYFGEARQKSTSHRVYKTPWQGNPRVNIQDNKGKAKAYQVGQVILAIDRLERENSNA